MCPQTTWYSTPSVSLIDSGPRGLKVSFVMVRNHVAVHFFSEDLAENGTLFTEQCEPLIDKLLDWQLLG